MRQQILILRIIGLVILGLMVWAIISFALDPYYGVTEKNRYDFQRATAQEYCHVKLEGQKYLDSQGFSGTVDDGLRHWYRQYEEGYNAFGVQFPNSAIFTQLPKPEKLECPLPEILTKPL